MSVNPLSNPKGVRLECEMCGKTATIQCTSCRVTYYCTREHQLVDWQGIHEKICPLLAPLRTPPPIIGSEDERARRQYTLQMSQRALIDLTNNESSKFLVKGQFEQAIPGALQSLRFSIAVHGQGSIELVPSYLLLAEANLGLGRFKQAEEFLSLANWSVTKNPDCSNALRSQLHRNFGKLYAAQGQTADALQQLAEDVYYSSLEIGPEHVDTAGGYYHMANIFYSQRHIESALAMYDKVVDIWYKFLASVRNNTEAIDVIGEAQLAEAMKMLRQILDTRIKSLGETHIATGEARYTLGLLHLFMGEAAPARDNIGKALQIYTDHLGADHPSTADVQDVFQQLNEASLFGESQAPTAASAAEPSQPPAAELLPGASAADANRNVQSPIPMPPAGAGAGADDAMAFEPPM